MRRRLFNNAAGVIAAPALTAIATSVSFAVAPAFGTIAAPDYVPLMLDPPQGPTPSTSFEIVYLTAYTSGAFSGTITRGQEGTTAVAHNVGAVWAQAPTASDMLGTAPIGAIMPYTGTGDPPEGNWLICDGRLIGPRGSTYAEFFARTQHVYNGGVDPGSGQVRIPDKRGLKSVGALNMGSALGAGAADNNHINAAQGAAGGVATYVLQNGEMPQHKHGGAVGSDTPDHQHYMYSGTANENVAHSHAITVNGADLGLNLPASGSATFSGYSPGASSAGGNFARCGTTSVGNTTGSHGHGASSGTDSVDHAHLLSNWSNQNGGGPVPGWMTNHGHSINNDGGAVGAVGGHQNIDPYQADTYIVRVA